MTGGPPHPGSLNRIPCTADQYMQLCDSIEDRYELVSGRLLWREMADRRHQDIQAFFNMKILHGHAMSYFKVMVYVEPNVNFLRPYDAPSEPISSSSDSDKDNRIADVAPGDYMDEEVRHNLSPNSARNLFSIKKLPRVIIEVTSPSNRCNDIEHKWVQYANYGIPEYYIVDRQEQCVTYGYFSSKEKASYTGRGGKDDYVDPDSSGPRLYCKKVFRGEQIIEGKYLGMLKIGTTEALNPPYVVDWLKQLEEQRQWTLKETEIERDYHSRKREEAESKARNMADEICKKDGVIRNLAEDMRKQEEESKLEKKRHRSTEEKLESEQKGISALEQELQDMKQLYVHPEVLALIRKVEHRNC